MPRKPSPISDQLRKAIDASAMSRYRICKEIGLPESTMSQFMSHQCGLQLSTIDRIGALLGLRLMKAPKRVRGVTGARGNGRNGRPKRAKTRKEGR